MQARPSQPFQIREMEPEDQQAVMALARSLAEFFPHDVIPVIRTSLDKNPVLIGELGEELAAFLVYVVRDMQTAEIVWMGVKEEYHGLGLGTMMLDALEGILRQAGIHRLVGSTLSYTVPYKPYEKVRSFYYNRGFSSLGMQQDYYGDGMDRLILVKDLGG